MGFIEENTAVNHNIQNSIDVPTLLWPPPYKLSGLDCKCFGTRTMVSTHSHSA